MSKDQLAWLPTFQTCLGSGDTAARWCPGETAGGSTAWFCWWPQSRSLCKGTWRSHAHARCGGEGSLVWWPGRRSQNTEMVDPLRRSRGKESGENVFATSVHNCLCQSFLVQPWKQLGKHLCNHVLKYSVLASDSQYALDNTETNSWVHLFIH